MKNKIMNILNITKEMVSMHKNLCKKILAVVIIIIAIMVIASCIKGKNYGNSAGNSYNYGLATQEGKWIYYVEYDDEEPVGIYKVKANGKKTEKVTDGIMYYLNIVDNYIYCAEYDEDDNQANLIKMKTNGKNKEILARNIDKHQITVVDKWVYYFKDDNLYRVELNGTGREKVSSKTIRYYHIEDNWIYYIYVKEGAQYIAKMKLNGDDSEKITKADSDSNETFESLYIKNGKIYYIASKKNDDYDLVYYLYRMNKKGEKVEKICKLDEEVRYINMQEDAIYYTVLKDYDTCLIKSIKYNGTDKTTVKKAKYISGINIVEDWIIYLTTNGDYESVVKMVRKDGEKEKEL